MILPGFRIVALGRMAPDRGGAPDERSGGELARAGAWGCHREAARRAPKVLRRSGRTTRRIPLAHRAARQATRHVIDSLVGCAPGQEVVPAAPGALRAPLKETVEKVLTSPAESGRIRCSPRSAIAAMSDSIRAAS